MKLSLESVQINVIHKAVGQITESDILLASASDAIVIGFNVRPMGNARMIAEKEEIDIRLYSIIYAAIDEIKSAIEIMLSEQALLMSLTTLSFFNSADNLSVSRDAVPLPIEINSAL